MPTSPLLTVPNVVLTPHVGSRTYESVERQAVTIVENTLRVLSGQLPHAPVPSVATGCSLPAFPNRPSRVLRPRAVCISYPLA